MKYLDLLKKTFLKITLRSQQESTGNIPEKRTTAEFMSFSNSKGQFITSGGTFLTDVAFIFQNVITHGKEDC